MPTILAKKSTWKALYKGKWYNVLDVVDQGGNGNENKYLLENGPSYPVKVETYDPFGGGTKMDKDEIVSVLRKRYPEAPAAKLESVAADIYYSGEPAAILASQNVLDKLFKGFESKMAEVEAKNAVQVESNEFCPICKSKTQKVMLADDVPAVWCKLHHVVFPVKEA